MKKRLPSAIIALALLIPIFLQGGIIYYLAIYILSLIGLYEFLKVKSTKKELPAFIDFISYIVMTLLVLGNTSSKEIIYMVDFRVIAGLFLVFLMPTVLYHDKKKYSINDAFYLIGGIFFLGTSFSLLIILRNINLSLIIYLFLITIMTDTYAYITGMLIGKHKLLESISPNKTWEGMIGGTIFGLLISATFYHVVYDPTLSLNIVVLMTLFLSILGQFGDLCFSGIKRYFGVKDFSNVMPGHGGILDRLDSIIFVIIGYMFFITII